jgi:class 3 adenylate cyclase
VAGDSHSFLFADLVGFTTLTAERGDDHGADVALAFHRRVRDLLESHGADEVKTIGDGVMLRCGDPAAAVRLAVSIVVTLDRDPGFPPVRVGVHTGPAVERDGDWYGTTVNVAARLCSAAAGGEVLVSEDTRAAAGRLPKVVFADRRLHWLKNVAQPVGAHAAEPKETLNERIRRPLAALLPDPETAT